MKKTIVSFGIFSLLLSSSPYLTLANGQESVQIQEEKIKKIQEEQMQLKQDESTIHQRISQYDFQISQYQKEIKLRTLEIDELERNKNKLDLEMQIMERFLQSKKNEFNQKLSSYYLLNSKTGFMEYLLESKNIKDFVDRLLHFEPISAEDKQWMDEYLKEVEELEEKKKERNYLSTKIAMKQQKVKKLNSAIEELRREKLRYLNDLQQVQKDIEEYQIAEEEAKNILEAQQQYEILDEETRQDVINELFVKAKQYAETSKQQNYTNITTDPNGQNIVYDTETDGIFAKPATGSITSKFGPRWGRFHYGIDIGKNGRVGNVPVIASADGTVIRAYYSSSYGNVVFIRHTINGKIFTTVYAHLENLAVSSGQQVKKGQFLGNMGNTGRSFGPHLHFEIHEGNWQLDKKNAVDPLKYIK